MPLERLLIYVANAVRGYVANAVRGDGITGVLLNHLTQLTRPAPPSENGQRPPKALTLLWALRGVRGQGSAFDELMP